MPHHRNRLLLLAGIFLQLWDSSTWISCKSSSGEILLLLKCQQWLAHVTLPYLSWEGLLYIHVVYCFQTPLLTLAHTVIKLSSIKCTLGLHLHISQYLSTISPAVWNSSDHKWRRRNFRDIWAGHQLGHCPLC
jgi:hypothetical protein